VEKKKKSADPSDSEDKGEPEQQTRQKVVRRFGGRADLIDEDDSDLAPQGASDTEVTAPLSVFSLSLEVRRRGAGV
jgi:hypothetical protein